MNAHADAIARAAAEVALAYENAADLERLLTCPMSELLGEDYPYYLAGGEDWPHNPAHSADEREKRARMDTISLHDYYDHGYALYGEASYAVLNDRDHEYTVQQEWDLTVAAARKLAQLRILQQGALLERAVAAMREAVLAQHAAAQAALDAMTAAIHAVAPLRHGEDEDEDEDPSPPPAR